MSKISRDVIDMLHIRDELWRLADHEDTYAELTQRGDCFSKLVQSPTGRIGPACGQHDSINMLISDDGRNSLIELGAADASIREI